MTIHFYNIICQKYIMKINSYQNNDTPNDYTFAKISCSKLTSIISIIFMGSVLMLLSAYCFAAASAEEPSVKREKSSVKKLPPSNKRNPNKLLASSTQGSTQISSKVIPENIPSKDVNSLCLSVLKSFPGKYNSQKIQQVCKEAKLLESCTSTNGENIFYYERKGEAQLKILVFSLMHGDELDSGSVARAWMERLTEISPRSTWRIIPLSNPDGWRKNSRTNNNGVDINRNFPTKNWHREATKYWEKSTQKNPRRFPGISPGSEKETKCVMKHIQDFSPNLIVSIHTPLGLLDLDGPKVHHYPQYKKLPWLRLGNYPGSLGRYMWQDKKVPVLTIELRGSNVINNMSDLDRLQDISGLIALMANKKTLLPISND